ncbi:MAG: cytochrome c biogenesis heme-transporting ATPase CcmA [Burkholderiales bacterium]|nr:cytochrome c biogenesis heme-transporting ATPase CcmA [Burkholderiales bacterium]
MLEARDLAGRRGHARLFTGVSFAVAPGEALVVAGPNGTGKTTLLRMLAGLAQPEAGEIRWRGQPVRTFAAALRQSVAYSGHATALKDDLSTEENLVSLVSLAGVPVTPGEAHEAISAVSLSRQRNLPARVLSAGQRRRVGLARLRLLKRPLWILDEPTTALDAAGIDFVAGMMREQLSRGGIVVAATHQPLDFGAARVSRLALGG